MFDNSNIQASENTNETDQVINENVLDLNIVIDDLFNLVNVNINTCGKKFENHFLILSIWKFFLPINFIMIKIRSAKLISIFFDQRNYILYLVSFFFSKYYSGVNMMFVNCQ